MFLFYYFYHYNLLFLCVYKTFVNIFIIQLLMYTAGFNILYGQYLLIIVQIKIHSVSFIWHNSKNVWK